jgi:hypothetical protein
MEWTEEEERHKSELRKHCFEELDKGKDLTEDDQCLVIAATFGDRLKRWNMSVTDIYEEWFEARSGEPDSKWDETRLKE